MHRINVLPKPLQIVYVIPNVTRLCAKNTSRHVQQADKIGTISDIYELETEIEKGTSYHNEYVAVRLHVNSVG